MGEIFSDKYNFKTHMRVHSVDYQHRHGQFLKYDNKY